MVDRAVQECLGEAVVSEPERVLAEVRDSSPLAKRIHDSYFSFQELHEAYVAVSEMSYFAARR